jgi:chemotaxis protein CheY-P-specific phosphatase CheC
MKTVEIPVPANDISTPMSNMRQWLDQKQVESSRFSIKGAAGRFVLHIRFNVAEHAAAFAKDFAGRVL